MASRSLDLDERVANFINDHLDLPAELVMGEPSMHGSSVAYVMRPLQKYKVYFDGRKKRTFSFDIQAKCPFWLDAINILNAINELMENAKSFQLKSNNGSFQFTRAEMTHSPSFAANVTDNLDVVTGNSAGDNVFAIYIASFEVTAIITK
ncbi:hypothetical protein M5C72_07100 [Companilactobacillus allii]|uniref:Minor capsid protein n=1 Tax=Companilactobacillus allii TaxID=1847728 RepID=A0A1P8Q4S7_9LACO|nr:hypothetical protein [Companilactobacillus allii]APX72864.1 hypothetical protein BTM29_10015 [Companilactobacillus allii]USQ67652.1 hypothetical protein M5C72_07100 [Companilactobacillus allii]